ncbi:hypothetical protein D1AOALGA4SA_10669 [Olavius algarvensis Delta 1 endosymbiont]|nr:hypothetical protein D1AOALGA4SA_10669 [Olavius algarvensis Delta 1 endosymbiont]
MCIPSRPKNLKRHAGNSISYSLSLCFPIVKEIGISFLVFPLH